MLCKTACSSGIPGSNPGRGVVLNMQATVQIQDVYKITGIGVVPVGVVSGGMLRIGMTLALDGRVLVLKSIEMHHESLVEARPGDAIGFSFVNLATSDFELLKKYKGQTVTFSDEGAVFSQQTPLPVSSTPNRPEGAFSWLTKIFKK
jgi:translation elongation factor EF-1alpha